MLIMKHDKKKAPLLIIGIFLSCSLIKDFEFLVLKTDRTFLAENIFCKLFAVGIIFVVLKKMHFSWGDIGFRRNGMAKGAVLGLSLGIFTFSVSYLIEYFIHKSMGLDPQFLFYIANFTISEQNVTGASLTALLICVCGNIVNVIAEEGLFRGLLFRIGKIRYTQRMANLIQAALFGVWHIITVIVWITEGTIGISAALAMSAGYVVLAGILGYEWGMCAALTGTLWAGVFEHFFNNFISNALHVVTETGVDELQIIRIVISNILSLSIVIILAKVHKHYKKGNILLLRR